MVTRRRAQLALSSLREMLDGSASDGEQTRVEAARIMGEIDHPTFALHLSRLIREDRSIQVISEAMAAAGKRKYPEAVGEIVFRLGDKNTKARRS